ncbi:MAG: class I SAM-dependent methyltransferase [Fibrobacteres bacterium]|nr:class I SAM-dependent methyltransferase [Fibrobacterota bacterium]
MDLSRKWQFIFAERARRFKTPHDISHWSKEGFNIRFKAVGQELKRLVKPESRILDLGSGPGYYTSLLSNPVLFDYTHAVFKNVRSSKASDRVVGTMQYMPFKDSSFDGILCVGVLQCMDLKVEFLENVYNALKPGGWFLFETLNAECRELLDDLNKRDSKRLSQYLNDKSSSESHIVYDDFALYHADRLSADFAKAKLNVHAVKWMYPYTLFPRLQMRYYTRCFYLWGRKEI